MSVMPAPTASNPNPSFGVPVRIPIEADNTTANTVDLFIPGISADPSTSGTSAHLGLYFYSFPVAACAFSDPGNPANECDLRVGFVSSIDGGTTWSAPSYIAHMSLNELARTSQGLMVGDYSTAAVIPSGHFAGNSISAFSVGLENQPQDQPIYVATHGLPIVGGNAAARHASVPMIRRAKKQGGYKQKNVPPDQDHG